MYSVKDDLILEQCYFDIIEEARKERYLEMFRDPYFDETEMLRANRIIKKASDSLKNPNAVMWILRDYRDKTLEASKFNDEEKLKFIYQITKRMIDVFNHYESLGIKKIDNYDWPKDKSNQSIETYFRTLENEWKKTRNQWIDITDELKRGDIEKVMDVGNKFVWFNLNKRYCRLEGDAMGHCGNAGSPQYHDTVLSLRRIEHKGNKVFSRPSLTFILNYKNGVLGEMKGRANEKPKSEYHPYILKLLTHQINGEWMIKGINGGGYKPENNFQIKDLSPGDKIRLYRVRPDLKLLTAYHEELGNSPKFIEILKNKLTVIFPENPIEVTTTSSDKLVITFKEVWQHWGALLDSFGGRIVPKNLDIYIDYLQGDKDLEYYDVDLTKDDCESLFDHIFNKNNVATHRISNYVTETYGNELDNYDSVFELLWDNNDDIISTLKKAIIEGLQTGAMNQLTNRFKDGITNLTIILYNGISIRPEFESETNWYDSNINMISSLDDILKADSVGELTTDMFEDASEIDGDMNVPYNGFDDYDNQAAIDSFISNLDI
jgi:hypothetical protein